MLAAHYRLRKQSDIDFVYKHGRKVYQPLVSVVYCTGQTGFTRTAIVVSQRVCSHAVDRNRIKRCLRAALSTRLPKLKPAHDMIIIVQSKARRAQPTEVIAQLDKILTKIKPHAGS